MSKKRKILKDVRYFGVSILFILLLAGIFVVPIRNNNITLQMEISGAEDGSEVQLVIEEDGNIFSIDEQPIYQDKVEFALNPEYFDVTSFMLKINSEDRNISWNNLAAFSGQYDTNVDRRIYDEKVTADLVETDEGECLKISNQVIKNLQSAIYNNYAVKIPLALFIIALYVLFLVHLSKSQSLCKKVIKNVLLCIFAIIAIYIVFYNDLNKEYEVETVQMPQALVQDSESKIDMRNIIWQTFDSELKNLHAISISFQIDSQEYIDEEAKFGIRVWKTDEENILSQNIFSYKSLQQSPTVTIELNEKNIESDTNITVEIKHLSGEVPTSIKIPTASGEIKKGQVLYSNGAVIEDTMVMISSSYEQYLARDLAKILEVFIVILFLFVIFGNAVPINNKYVIAITYGCALLYSIVQIGYYMIYVGHTPDEMRHISYIAYLENSGNIIPNFPEMEFLTDTNPASFVPNSLNQLGHPPLYYHIMRLCNPIDNLGNGEYYIHLLRLRVFSAFFGVLAIAIVFYIGYRKISKTLPVLHLLYTAFIINIPMFLYNLSGVNNDTFVLLGCSIFFLGFLELSEGKRKYGIYWLIAIGFGLTILSKLTAGLILILMSSIFIVWHCIKEKSIRLLACRQFVSTLPVYLITICYFLIVYSQVHSFQPSLANMDMEYYQSTAFYVMFEDRTVMNFKDYFFRYWQEFFRTWTGIASHISLLKLGTWLSYDRFFAILVAFMPAFCLFVNKNKEYVKMFISFYISLVCVVLLQFKNAYNGFYFVSGYPGAYQSRYYLCVLPIMAFISVWLIEYAYLKFREKIIMLNDKDKTEHMITRLVMIISVTISAFLFYSGFIYFLLNYSN